VANLREKARELVLSNLLDHNIIGKTVAYTRWALYRALD
jgi:hypothetical protein